MRIPSTQTSSASSSHGIPTRALLLPFLFAPCLAYTSQHTSRRDIKSLNSDAIQAIVELDPPQWESVEEGHLGKLLIPRACE
jgi:hypothetical protein